jgi:hypothetical protein
MPFVVFFKQVHSFGRATSRPAHLTCVRTVASPLRYIVVGLGLILERNSEAGFMKQQQWQSVGHVLSISTSL